MHIARENRNVKGKKKRGKNTSSLKKNSKKPILHSFSKELEFIKKKKHTTEIMIKFRKQAKKLATGLKFVKKYLFKMKVVPFFLSPFSCSWIKSQLSHFLGTPCPLGSPEQFVKAAFFPSSHNWTPYSHEGPLFSCAGDASVPSPSPFFPWRRLLVMVVLTRPKSS